MLKYPARVGRDGNGYMVSFRDIPEALTSGATREEAVEMAHDALATAMEFYLEDRRPVPMPSEPRKGEVLIDLPASMSAKMLLLNAMIESGVSPAKLARRLGTSPQVVNRIVNFRHSTKIDTIAEAIEATGKRLEMRVL